MNKIIEFFTDENRNAAKFKFFRNAIVFTAPAFGIFFYQLSQGAELKVAFGVALLALYGLFADLFGKISEE